MRNIRSIGNRCVVVICLGGQLRWLEMVKDFPKWIINSMEKKTNNNQSKPPSLTSEEQKRLDAIARQIEFDFYQ